MKKIWLVWVAILMLFTTPLTAFAQTSSEQDVAPASGAVSLKIDDKNIYNGMDRAYQNGYTPGVKDGVATIIIPLITEGEIKGNKIVATPELGDPSSSPFLFKNYQKTISLSQNAVTGSNTAIASYFVRFDLALAPGRTNRSYPVTINIQAEGADGSPIQQSFTSYVTISDGKEQDTSASTEPTPASQPKIIVSGCNIDPSPIIAGEEFKVRITLKNTSETQSVQNMTVTATCESPNISLQNESDTIYINNLGKGKTTEITLAYKTDLETPAGRYNIALAITYDNADAVTLSSSGTVPFEISQPLRVEMEKPQIAAQVNTGDTFSVTIQVMNLGRSIVYNVRAEINAPGLFPLGTAFIGNMETGTAMPGEMDIFVGTKDMTEGNQSGGKYGKTSGTVTLIYEDAAGQEYKEEIAFTTTINEPSTRQDGTEQTDEPKKAGQWWISIVIIITFAAGLAGFLIVRKKQRVIQNEDI